MEFNIVHLTDIHGMDNLIHEIGDELGRADIILISGDITHFGRKKETQLIIRRIQEYNHSILAVPGNCDHSEVEEYLSQEKLNLHKKHIMTDAFTICGLGGSLPCPGKTPSEYTEQQADIWLSELITSIETDKPLIFLSHEPPLNTVCDRLYNGDHVGSISVRKFIEDTCPVLCLTGHIHEGIGIDAIGNCVIINPGPFRMGYYASIKITGENSVNYTLKQITAH